jgi:hypothetical protein
VRECRETPMPDFVAPEDLVLLGAKTVRDWRPSGHRKFNTVTKTTKAALRKEGGFFALSRVALCASENRGKSRLAPFLRGGGDGESARDHSRSRSGSVAIRAESRAITMTAAIIAWLGRSDESGKRSRCSNAGRPDCPSENTQDGSSVAHFKSREGIYKRLLYGTLNRFFRHECDVG